MGFFDRGHEKESPLGNLRAHIGTFMYYVKVGKSKFKNKGAVGAIFVDMDNTKFLFQQATSGTMYMYDMKKKLDYTLWDAAIHKYTEDIQKLKDELLKAVDEGEENGSFMEEKEEEKKAEEEKEKEKEKTTEEEPIGDWKAHIKGQMKEAEEKARREEEESQKEKEQIVAAAEDTNEALTEADCRELWRLIQGLEREYKEMNRIADEWFAVHGKKTGCLTALVGMTLIPLGAMYGLYYLL